MNTLEPRPFSFSNGRPKGQVFQTVSTLDLPPKQQYARWAEEVIRGYRVVSASEGQRRDFQATITSLANAAGEMHYIVADGYQVCRPRCFPRDELALFLMLKGHADVVCQGAAQRIEAGGFFVIDGRHTAAVAWSRHVAIQLDISRPLLESAFSGAPPAPRQINAALARSRLADMLRSQLAQFPLLAESLPKTEQQALLDASESLAITTMAGAFAARHGSRPGSHSGLFAAAQRYIERHLPSSDLNPACIAAAIGCSRSTLYKLFAQHDLTVQGHIRELRLQRLRRLLEQDQGASSTPIYLLAARCGFEDMANLSRMYRQRFGMSPREARAASSW